MTIFPQIIDRTISKNDLKMTNQQILKKAIEKAINNGYLDVDGKAWIHSLDNGIGVCHQAIIFNHNFAKAFWGVEMTSSLSRERQPNWQFHLQQMVLKKDPVKYLEQFVH